MYINKKNADYYLAVLVPNAEELAKIDADTVANTEPPTPATIESDDPAYSARVHGRHNLG